MKLVNKFFHKPHSCRLEKGADVHLELRQWIAGIGETGPSSSMVGFRLSYHLPTVQYKIVYLTTAKNIFKARQTLLTHNDDFWFQIYMRLY